MTSTPTFGYFDGWTDALTLVEKDLNAGDRCPHCAIADARFQGLATAAEIADQTEGMAGDQITEQLVRIAQNPSLIQRTDLIYAATQVVELKPNDARDALVTLALIAAKRYDRQPLPNEVEQPTNNIEHLHA